MSNLFGLYNSKNTEDHICAILMDSDFGYFGMEESVAREKAIVIMDLFVTGNLPLSVQEKIQEEVCLGSKS
jgi:hypothetical protein